jgi:hypothetical protein
MPHSCQFHARSCQVYSYYACFWHVFWHETAPVRVHAAFMQVQASFMLIHSKCILIMHVFGMFFSMLLSSSHSCRIHASTNSFHARSCQVYSYYACFWHVFWHETVPVRIHAAFMQVQNHFMLVHARCILIMHVFWHEAVPVRIHAAFMQVQTHFMRVHAKCIPMMHVFGMFFGMKLYQFVFMPHSCKYKLISCSFMPGVFLLCMFLACFWYEVVPVRIYASFLQLQRISCIWMHSVFCTRGDNCDNLSGILKVVPFGIHAITSTCSACPFA